MVFYRTRDEVRALDLEKRRKRCRSVVSLPASQCKAAWRFSVFDPVSLFGIGWFYLQRLYVSKNLAMSSRLGN